MSRCVDHERAQGKAKALWAFAGTNGGGVLEVESHEELDAIMARFPFAPFSTIEIIALSDWVRVSRTQRRSSGDGGGHGQAVAGASRSTLGPTQSQASRGEELATGLASPRLRSRTRDPASCGQRGPGRPGADSLHTTHVE